MPLCSNQQLALIQTNLLSELTICFQIGPPQICDANAPLTAYFGEKQAIRAQTPMHPGFGQGVQFAQRLG